MDSTAALSLYWGMRPFALLALLLPLLLASAACKSTPSSSGSTAAGSTAQPTADNPHAGLDPASAARAESARAAGVEPTAASHDHSLGPQISAPHGLAALGQGRSGLGPFSLQVPADWKEKPSVSNMRAAEFELPASNGQAEVIVYYFGQSGAGSVQANIDRWVSQFKQPDGKPSSEVTKIDQATFAGQSASLVSVSGQYASQMPGGEPVDKADQSLLAAIVPSPKGPYYFRLIGDRAAVAAQTDKFRELLSSLKLE
ncbi:MAG: hypothetical protein ABI895_40145 [Deltaproteobacteria bacterium]